MERRSALVASAVLILSLRVPKKTKLLERLGGLEATMTNPAASNNEILAIIKIGISIVGMQVQAPAIARIHVTVTYFAVNFKIPLDRTWKDN